MSRGRDLLSEKGRVVFKVGTSTLTHANGKANLRSFDLLARVLSDVRNMGRDVILVSSGAIGVGMGKLAIERKPGEVAARQAIAAVGQCVLMQLYGKSFAEYGHVVGQILLTRDVVDYERTRQNAVNTFETLIGMGIIPIVNENDSVATEELETVQGHNAGFGDNDALSAIVAALVGADLLVILTDTDGLHEGDPRANPGARLIREVERVTPEIERVAGGAGGQMGTGGMVTKVEAAKAATERGIDVILMSGRDPLRVYEALRGEEVGTFFRAQRPGRP
jgi:glutamate 5-kinase